MGQPDYKAKSRYQGNEASSYDQYRVQTPQWLKEDLVLTEILKSIQEGSKILDAPVGTGRMLDLAIGQGHSVVGLDVSADMLAEAKSRRSVDTGQVRLVQGDLESIPSEVGDVDYAFSVRFLNWVPLETFRRVVEELARVARVGVIIHVRSRRRASTLELAGEIGSRASRIVPAGIRRVRTLLLPNSQAIPFGAAQGYVFHGEQDIVGVLGDAGLVIKRRWHTTTRVSLRERTASPSFFYLAEHK